MHIRHGFDLGWNRFVALFTVAVGFSLTSISIAFISEASSGDSVSTWIKLAVVAMAAVCMLLFVIPLWMGYRWSRIALVIVLTLLALIFLFTSAYSASEARYWPDRLGMISFGFAIFSMCLLGVVFLCNRPVIHSFDLPRRDING